MSFRPPPVRSALSAIALQWVMRAIGLVSLIILARLLSPADFGVIGLAMTAVAVVEIFSSIGLRQVLVRMPAPERSYLDTAWTIQLVLFSGLGLALAGAAPWVAEFYGRPSLAPVIAVLSTRFVLLGLINIGIVDFDRKFQFGRDLAMRLSGRIVSLIAAVCVAILFRSYWALVVGMIAQAVCLAVASYVFHPFRPRFSLQRRKELMGVSAWIFLSQAAQTIQSQVDRIVLGRHASTADVGGFAVSKDLSEIFTSEIATALNRVSYVETSRAGALAIQGARIGQLLGFYALITAPLGLGLAAVSTEFFAIFLGDRWLFAAQLTVLLAPAGAVYAVYRLVLSSLLATGHDRLGAFLSVGTMAITLSALISAAMVGATGAVEIAWLTLLACLLSLVGGVVVLARKAGVTALSMIGEVGLPFGAALFMFFILRWMAWPRAPELALIGKMLVGVPLYFGGLAVIWMLPGRSAGAVSLAAAFARKSVLRLMSPSRGT